ncbi:MAG: hypothetical protein K2N73_15730 [Lachnospiraceae bacterium]|nr:hypothetical protein [Lachnospiraceae bacterium]
MIKLLSALLLAVVSILPNSPFQTTLDGEIYKLDFLPYLNWFIPFDNCLKITQLWLAAITLYYVYDIVMDIVNRMIIEKI